MRTNLIRALAAAAAAFTAAGAAMVVFHRPVAAPAHPEPVVVELFTSSSCPQCPKAENALAALCREASVNGAEIIPLALHVDFGGLPMKRDPLAQDAFLERQKAYIAAMGGETAFTPQIVVDGRPQSPGCTDERLRGLVAEASRVSKGYVRMTLLAFEAGTARVSIRVSPMSRTGSDVYLAVVENGVPNPSLRLTSDTPQTLMAVARSVTKVAHVMPGDEEYMTQATVPIAAEWRPEAVQLIAFAQRASDGAIVAAGRIPLAP